MQNPCKKCGSIETYKNNKGNGRYVNICANCHRERMRKIYATDDYRRKKREYDRFRRRNCKKEYYNELVKKQKGKCVICKIKIDEKLRIDHDHKTNKLRGLLCDHCNWGLGHFKDNIKYLKNAIKYLEKHK